MRLLTRTGKSDDLLNKHANRMRASIAVMKFSVSLQYQTKCQPTTKSKVSLHLTVSVKQEIKAAQNNKLGKQKRYEKYRSTFWQINYRADRHILFLYAFTLLSIELGRMFYMCRVITTQCLRYGLWLSWNRFFPFDIRLTRNSTSSDSTVSRVRW